MYIKDNNNHSNIRFRYDSLSDSKPRVIAVAVGAPKTVSVAGINKISASIAVG